MFSRAPGPAPRRSLAGTPPPRAAHVHCLLRRLSQRQHQRRIHRERGELGQNVDDWALSTIDLSATMK